MRSVSVNFLSGVRSALYVAALAAVVATSACSGGGSSGSPGMPAAPGPSATPSANTASVTFTIKWPAATTSSASRGRRPHYLPATALSASISVNGGVAEYINSPTSTLTFPAPVGLDTFLVRSYDEQNGDGNVLSSANITQTVSGSTANVVSTTLNGVIASLSVVLSTYTTPAGALRNVAVAVNGLDADGNTIVGPADYNTPISLAIVDPANSGTLSLAKKLFQAPSSGTTLAYSGGSLWSASLVASAAGVPSVSATFAPTPTFYQHLINKPGTSPQQLIQGPDGNIWFTDHGTASIGKMTPSGTVTEYPVMTANPGLYSIISASDGRLWFTETTGSKIGAITTAGTVSEYNTVLANDTPYYLINRSDGNIWYAGTAQNDIAELTLAGAPGIAVLSPTAGSQPYGIVAAPNGNIYFTEFAGGRVGVVDVSDTANDSAVLLGNALPGQIVLGPDGNLWFAEQGLNQVASFSTRQFAVIGTYPVTKGSAPFALVAGKDGAVWFTENTANRIGRIAADGTLTEYEIPTFAYLGPAGIAVASDGSLWFCEPQAGEIARFVY